MNQRGSVLVLALGLGSLFAIYASTLVMQGSQDVYLLKRRNEQFKARVDFLSAINYFNMLLEADEEQHEDSKKDAWHGELSMVKENGSGIRIKSRDEGAKINLNMTSEACLKMFFERFENEVSPLKGEAKNLVKRIVERRTEARLLSIDELLLLEDVETTDIEKLKSLITVYPEQALMNINTVEPIVLNSVLDSLNGDAHAKEELAKRIFEYRDGESFRAADLMPEVFMRKLALAPSPQTVQLVNFLLLNFDTDSRYFSLSIESPNGMHANAVVRDAGYGKRVEVLSWHEA